MSTPSQETSSKSVHEPMEKPDIKADIPLYLLEGASEQDKYIIERLSYLSQHAQWSEKAHLNTHAQLRYTNGNVIENKTENERLSKEIESLKTQSDIMSPIFRPISFFAKLWEYKLFKWLFLLGCACVVMLVYPFYLKHSSSWIDAILTFIGFKN